MDKTTATSSEEILGVPLSDEQRIELIANLVLDILAEEQAQNARPTK